MKPWLPLLAVLAFGCGKEAPPTLPMPTSGGATAATSDRKPLANVSFAKLEGGKWNLSDERGKVTVLNFWATWCPPCVEEIPEFVEVSEDLKEKGLSVVGVSLDEEGAKVVEPFVKENRITYPILLSDGKEPLVTDMPAIPVTIVLDRQGREVKRFDGMISKTELLATVNPLLEEKP